MIILDTHIRVRWIIEGEAAIPAATAKALQHEDRVAVSAISCMEVMRLEKAGKLVLPAPASDWIKAALEPAGVESLEVTCEIASRAVQLPDHHKDPADRIIIATTLVLDASLSSVDEKFPLYEDLRGRLVR